MMNDMKRFDYPVRLVQKEGFVIASCRDFPDLLVKTPTIDDTINGVVNMMEVALTSIMTEGRLLPLPSQAERGEIRVSPPAEVVAKAALYVAMAGSGLTKVQLAKELGIDEKEVRRLLDPTYRSKLPRLAQAVDRLGYRLVIGLEQVHS